MPTPEDSADRAFTVTEEELARLKSEREEADHAYNAALTALDGAIQKLRDMPHPPPPYDDSLLFPLNKRWEVLAAKPEPTGWLRRFHSLVWSIVGPPLELQQAFNAALVDHLNRNNEVHVGVTASAISTLAVVKEELEHTIAFQRSLMSYLQRLTPYVDTKDRELMSIVSGTLSSVTDEMRKRAVSTTTRERRLESRIDELRSSTAIAQRASQTLKRELERLVDGKSGQAHREESSPGAVVPGGSIAVLDSYKYVGFEDAFRGSTDDIRERLTSYVSHFEGKEDVLDVGCGRGEFLDLLRGRNVSGRGIDLNHEMVEDCRKRGLAVDEGDLLSYLRQLPDASLGGLFASQVVEHLEPDYLLASLDTAFHKLRPGSKIILETINVASWSAFFQSYVRDITHRRPLHPETLQYLVTASGFQNVDIVFASPCAEQNKLESVSTSLWEGDRSASAGLANLVAVFNENVEKLNALMFADQDYAVIGERP